MSEFEDDDAQDEEEEDTYSSPIPTNVPTPGYRPTRNRSAYPPDSPSPELIELETGEPDDFSQGVHRQEDPHLRIQPSRKCKLRPKPSPLDQGMLELTADDRQRLLRQA